MKPLRLRDPLVFALPSADALAVGLAGVLHAEMGVLDCRDFPDGESYARVVTPPRSRDVVLVGSLHPANDQFMRVAFVADAARELGARRIGLVAPYLAYLRQDRRFHVGEAISSRSFARLLSRTVDWIATIDPHLHRLTSLAEVYDIPALSMDAAPLLGSWVRTYVTRPVIIGPDTESEQWARVVAESAEAPLRVMTKARHGAQAVQVTLPAGSALDGRTPVIVDDIVSSGSTLVAASELLRERGWGAPVCAVVHAVFGHGALARLSASGISRIVTTNTIAHPTNAIDVTPLIAGLLRVA